MSLLYEWPLQPKGVAIIVVLAIFATAVFAVVRAIQIDARARHVTSAAEGLPTMPALAVPN